MSDYLLGRRLGAARWKPAPAFRARGGRVTLAFGPSTRPRGRLAVLSQRNPQRPPGEAAPLVGRLLAAQQPRGPAFVQGNRFDPAAGRSGREIKALIETLARR